VTLTPVNSIGGAKLILRIISSIDAALPSALFGWACERLFHDQPRVLATTGLLSRGAYPENIGRRFTWRTHKLYKRCLEAIEMAEDEGGLSSFPNLTQPS
jgi:hypothetical protein